MQKYTRSDWQPEPLKFTKVLEVNDENRTVTVKVKLTDQAATIKEKWIEHRQGDTIFIPRWLCRKIFADHHQKENK